MNGIESHPMVGHAEAASPPGVVRVTDRGRKCLHMLEIFESIENENELAILANNNVAPEIEFSWDED